MNIFECPEKYRIYNASMSNGSRHEITGETKRAIMDSKTAWIELPNGSLINKNFIVEFKLNVDRTRENVQKHSEEIKNSIVKINVT